MQCPAALSPQRGRGEQGYLPQQLHKILTALPASTARGPGLRQKQQMT